MLQLNRRTGCLQKRINLGIVNESLSQNKKLGGIAQVVSAYLVQSLLLQKVK
jgi:hypothetical protein